ncbi:MAG: HAMP domain-containing histidine kinase [Firmicutes bacterium]|nr:HAMP domain-containing histidine kinase [Bacillota bacterium]
MGLREHRERISRASLQGQIFTCLLVFSGLMLLLLWLLQVVYLDEFYERIKNQQIESAAASVIQSLDTEDMEQAAADAAQSRDICVSVYRVTSISGLAVQVEEVCQADVLANCLIHHMTDASLMKYYDEAAAAQSAGEPCYTQRISMDAFGTARPDQEEEKEGGDNALWNRFTAPDEGLPDYLIYARLASGAAGGQYLLLLNSTITPVNSTVATLRVQLIIISAALILMALLLSTVIAHWLGRPLAGLTKSARRLAQGNFAGTFEGGGCREIDELASTLNYASAELARSGQLQQDITANISHDLRTPLTMIGGYAEFMRDFPEEDHSESIDVIISETQRLSALVRDVLDSSRLASGVETLKPSSFCLSDLLSDIAARYRALLEKDGFRLELDAPEDIWVRADEVRLDQAISNLLNNAMAHCGEDKLIRLSLKVNEGTARVEIEDHGPGIPKEDLPLIWQRYYRTDAPARSVKGSGLGLSIVRGIFDLHGLRYGVRSQVGRGSTFWFELSVLE